jgi:hypothetical protein
MKTMTDEQLNKLRAKVGLPPIEPYVPYSDRCAQEAEALTKEKRQEFMDNLTQKGMNLGEAHKAADISFEAALGIMNRQIKSAHYLQTTVS